MVQLQEHEFAWLCHAATNYARYCQLEDTIGALMKDGYFHLNKGDDSALVNFASRVDQVAEGWSLIRDGACFGTSYKGHILGFIAEPKPGRKYDWEQLWSGVAYKDDTIVAETSNHQIYRYALEALKGKIDGTVI